MADITLVTGGSRSGKSRYAQERAELTGKKRLFVATCPKIDDEMDTRIEYHIRDRAGRNWQTIEEETAIERVLGDNSDYDVVLVDCLTLWVNNLLFRSHQSEKAAMSEKKMQDRCLQLVEAAKYHRGAVFFVTNEVGSGIVPENKTVRLYRDLVGRCNQVIAWKAQEVFLVSCGIPMKLR